MNRLRYQLATWNAAVCCPIVSAVGDREHGGYVFLCYARSDSVRADELEHALLDAGIPVWRDTRDLWPGQDWQARIRESITNGALVFLACFSSQSIARRVGYQAAELRLAAEQARLRRTGDEWLIPVRFDDCDIPDLDLGGGRQLNGIHRADLFGPNRGEELNRLLTVVRRVLGSWQSEATDTERVQRPDRPSATSYDSGLAVKPAVRETTAPSANPPWRRIMSWDVAIRGALIGGACAIVAAVIALAPSFLGSQPGRNGGTSAAAPILATAQLPAPSAGFYGVWVLPGTHRPQFKRELSKLGMAVSGWASRYGGVYVGAVGSGTYVLTITGKAADGVTITDLGIRVIARRPPRSGTLICVLPQGVNSDIGLSFNLDSPEYGPTISGENLLNGRPFFADKNITLARNESITLTATFSASKSDYLFDLVSTIVLDGKAQNTLISGPNGRPFEVTGFASHYKAIFEPNSRMSSFLYVAPKEFSLTGSRYSC